jgi:hypothetical protein
VAQKAAFRGELMDAGEKSLQTFVAVPAFECGELLAVAFAGFVPSLGDIGGLLGGVADGQDGEAG